MTVNMIGPSPKTEPPSNLDIPIDYMEGTVARGMRMAARLLGIDDHDKLVDNMRIRRGYGENIDASLEKSLSMMAQYRRRERSPKYPTARDRDERSRCLMEFTGDTIPPDGPPMAWVLLWSGKYSNICGEYVPKPLRKSGYVMWDER